MLVFQPSIWDRLEACALAVLPIIICEQEGFRALAEGLVSSQPEATRPRLADAFHALLNSHGVTMSLDRPNRGRFQASMRQFVSSVRAFMLTQ
ncbi:unnamed protein product [Discosporangium mesarthrocarpum]